MFKKVWAHDYYCQLEDEIIEVESLLRRKWEYCDEIDTRCSFQFYKKYSSRSFWNSINPNELARECGGVFFRGKFHPHNRAEFYRPESDRVSVIKIELDKISCFGEWVYVEA